MQSTVDARINFWQVGQPPFPPETFGNLLLLYCKYQYYDLAADVMAVPYTLTLSHSLSHTLTLLLSLSHSLTLSLSLSLSLSHSLTPSLSHADVMAVPNLLLYYSQA